MSTNNWVSELASVLLILLAVDASACLSPSDEPKAQEPCVLTSTPLTVELELDDRTRSSIEQASTSERPKPIFLYIQGVIPPTDQELLGGIKIFVNKPEASAKTSVEDPHFATSFSLAPTTSKKKQDFKLDIAPILLTLKGRGQLDPTKPIKITLAAVPIDDDTSFPETFSMCVGRLTISNSTTAYFK